MAVTRWRRDGATEPADEIERLQSEINKLFDFESDFFGSGLFDRAYSPALNVVEHGDEFVVTCELPGVDQKDLEISLSNNILAIKGRKKLTSTSKRFVSTAARSGAATSSGRSPYRQRPILTR